MPGRLQYRKEICGSLSFSGRDVCEAETVPGGVVFYPFGNNGETGEAADPPLRQRNISNWKRLNHIRILH